MEYFEQQEYSKVVEVSAIARAVIEAGLISRGAQMKEFSFEKLIDRLEALKLPYLEDKGKIKDKQTSYAEIELQHRIMKAQQEAQSKPKWDRKA